MESWKFNFENLEVWQKARNLNKIVYTLSRNFPATEEFGLCSQMRRASVSVSSNIAEGVSRTSPRDQIRFIEIAYASLMELFCQIQIAEDVGLAEDSFAEQLRPQIKEIAAMLSGLRKSIERRTTQSKFL